MASLDYSERIDKEKESRAATQKAMENLGFEWDDLQRPARIGSMGQDVSDVSILCEHFPDARIRMPNKPWILVQVKSGDLIELKSYRACFELLRDFPGIVAWSEPTRNGKRFEGWLPFSAGPHNFVNQSENSHRYYDGRIPVVAPRVGDMVVSGSGTPYTRISRATPFKLLPEWYEAQVRLSNAKRELTMLYGQNIDAE